MKVFIKSISDKAVKTYSSKYLCMTGPETIVWSVHNHQVIDLGLTPVEQVVLSVLYSRSTTYRVVNSEFCYRVVNL